MAFAPAAVAPAGGPRQARPWPKEKTPSSRAADAKATAIVIVVAVVVRRTVAETYRGKASQPSLPGQGRHRRHEAHTVVVKWHRRQSRHRHRRPPWSTAIKDTNRVATKGTAAIADYIVLRLQLPGTCGAEPKHFHRLTTMRAAATAKLQQPGANHADK